MDFWRLWIAGENRNWKRGKLYTTYLSFVGTPSVFWIDYFSISQTRWDFIGSAMLDVTVIIRAQLLHALSLLHTLTAQWGSMNRRKDVVNCSLFYHSLDKLPRTHRLSPPMFPCSFRSYSSHVIGLFVDRRNGFHWESPVISPPPALNCVILS